MPAAVNEKLDLAYNFVMHTSRNVFLTGKAGTGKTTFLRQIRQSIGKRMVVVAPTGVAAINAGGVTIHSLFQLPFGPLVPGSAVRENNINREKIKIFRTLDLLVIDEISMVRADVLDGIDEVLRRYRHRPEPFGGVQLLLIGDMQQLPPVIRDEDWQLLSPYYETGYFFGSRALQQTPYVSIELTHIYRQADQRFIDMLNGIREKTITRDQLADLNQRYIPDFAPDERDGYITLSTHNQRAQQINSEKLKALKGKLRSFEAEIDKEFPAHAFPTDADLDLKIGAQVMFIKNDISRDKLYYNGKIGRVTDIDDDRIYVECQGDREPLTVERVSWENVRYALDPMTKEITSEVIGTFTQYPLKLAWAITIHKSQGLTFERAIIDASSAFAHGQVYVALSRCKTLDGLVLRAEIPMHSIKSEQRLDDFHEQVQQQTPTEQHLTDAKRAYQEQLLEELFSFETAHLLLHRSRKVIHDHSGAFSGDLMLLLLQLTELLTEKGRVVARRFVRQLPGYFLPDVLPEANEPLRERLQKAGGYFHALLTDEALPLLHRLDTATDNKQARDSLFENLDELEKELISKQHGFDTLRSAFDATAYQQARHKVELDFVPSRKKNEPAEKEGSTGKSGLYGALMKWRNELASEHGTTGFMVLPHKTVTELASQRPSTMDELMAIKGFGKTRARQIGADILRIIELHSGKPAKGSRRKAV
ncbi:HRDC domain-containing protein [uncultured Spirosoma sp.]|uniref:HRDC domain-containing protein n=1 Tax=uncultured Spirosoma sp. TaxID=278208 RepID=UPI00258F5066|nr:HRDC domain-containing protein [uncultured Spirosoma sp.]